MAEILYLESAVQRLVHDGDCMALEGFTDLIPVAAATANTMVTSTLVGVPSAVIAIRCSTG